MEDKTCGFGELLVAMCGADFRHSIHVGSQVMVLIFSTVPYYGASSESFSVN